MTPTRLEGQTLGKYRILEPLGRGGMAQVFRAYHPQLDRYVAVKVLRSDLVEEEEFLARFRREARAVAALRHPNIVQVYDFDVQDDFYYMVMELLEGDTLKARLNNYRGRGETIQLGEMVSILTDVLRGLAYAHAEGIIHRDIKPANILLTKRGEAVITDFGIAQIVGGTNYTVSGALMGTLHYMAPEQGLGNTADQRSDLYSLGIVTYEMLTGHPPFDADTPLAILLKHLNDPLPLPKLPGPIIPHPFERVVLKALEKKPEDRYQSAAEMSRSLLEAAAECQVEPWEPGSAAEIRQASPEDSASEGITETPPIYSGPARHEIADHQFASDDTDQNLSRSLNVQGSPGELMEAAVADVSKAAVALFSMVGGVVSNAISSAVSEIEEVKTSEQPPAEAVDGKVGFHAHQILAAAGADLGLIEDASANEIQTKKVGSAAVLGAGLLVGANLLAIGFGTITGVWAPFHYGWPAELLLVAILLSLLMTSLANIWLLIPAGILMGNGFLMAFYALTGNWMLWSFFWPLEPALIFMVIGSTLVFHNRPGSSRRLARRLGTVMTLASGVMVLGIGWGSILVDAFHKLFR